MSTSCGCFRFWLDDEEALDPGSREWLARAEHHRICADCREEMMGIVAQRAAIRGAFRPERAESPLPDPLVERCLNAMKRAARGERDAGQSAD